jgi:hypothetical protein
MLEPSRRNVRKLSEDPRVTVSSIEHCDPRRLVPKILIPDPNRKNARRLRLDPIVTKSKTDRAEPNCETPYTEQELPQRAKLRVEHELPMFR